LEVVQEITADPYVFANQAARKFKFLRVQKDKSSFYCEM